MVEEDEQHRVGRWKREDEAAGEHRVRGWRGREGMRDGGEKENENERKREIVQRYPILARPPAPTTPLPIFFQGVSHASSI